MKETTSEKAILIYSGNHSEGCECGNCSRYNHSYAVSVFLASDEELYYSGEELDYLLAIKEPLIDICGSSEEIAYSQAKFYCQQEGIEIGEVY